MSSQNPRPGEWGHSQDPLVEYEDDGWAPRYNYHPDMSQETGPYYTEFRRAHKEERDLARRQRHHQMRVEAEEHIQASREFDPPAEYVYAVSFGFMILGIGLFLGTVFPATVALFPITIGAVMVLGGTAAVIHDHRSKK